MRGPGRNVPEGPGRWGVAEAALWRGARALRRRAAAATGLAVLAAGGGLFVALTLVPTGFLEGRGSPLPLAASLLFGVVVAAGVAGAVGARRGLEPRTLAGEAERAAGLPAGDLGGALELDAAASGESAALARLHRERVGGALGERGPAGLYPEAAARWHRRLRWGGAVAAVAGILLALTAAVRPEPSAATARALAGGWRTAFPAPLPPLTVEPRGAAVPRGEWLQVRVRAPGRDRLTLAWRAAGERPRRTELRPGPDGWASGRLGPVEVPARYWAAAPDGAVSDTFGLRPLETLLVEALRVRIHYPAHLGREPESQGRPLPELLVPEGSRLVVEGRANRPLRRAALLRSPGRSDGGPVAGDGPGSRGAPPGAAPVVELAVEGARFAGVLRPVTSRWTWEIEAAGGNGAAGVAPPDPLTVRVVRDEAPSVTVVFPGRDTVLGAERALPLVVDVRDDMELRRVELVSWEARAAGGAGSARTEELPDGTGVRRAVLRPVLELGGRDLLPGDTALYLLRAYDGHPGHRPATTDTFRVGIAALPELRERRAEDAEALAAATRRAIEGAGELSRAAREARRRAGSEDPVSPGRGSAGEELGFGGTEEARRALDRGGELERRLAELEDEARRVADELAAASLSDPGLRDELRRLEELYRELRESALGHRLERLGRALRALEREPIREALERLAAGAEELRERLERSLGLLERAALEQAVKASRAEAERLADAQREMAGEPRPAAWAERQDRLAVEAGVLAERLDALEDRLAEAGAAEAAGASEVAERRVREARAAMEEAARGAEEAGAPAGTGEAAGEAARRGGAPGESSAAAARAAGSLDRAAEALSTAEAAMDREWREGALEALGTARREALALADEQGELGERLFGRGGLEGAAWRARQRAVRQGLENLLRSLVEAGRRTALMDDGVGPLAAEAAEAMDAILSPPGASGHRRRPLREEVDGVAEGLNELALRLLASERAVRASATAAGAEEALERMASLAQRQGGLARRTGGLAALGETGSERSGELRRLAEDQADIGRRLRALADRELLGRPGRMAEEAERLARRLGAGLIDEETVSDQRRLFRRMLDAGRSLEDDELDPTRRESRTAAAGPLRVLPADPPPVAGPLFPHPAEALLRELPAAYRRLVFEYFDRLNRGRVPSGATRPTEPEGERP